MRAHNTSKKASVPVEIEFTDKPMIPTGPGSSVRFFRQISSSFTSRIDASGLTHLAQCPAGSGDRHRSFGRRSDPFRSCRPVALGPSVTVDFADQPHPFGRHPDRILRLGYPRSGRTYGPAARPADFRSSAPDGSILNLEKSDTKDAVHVRMGRRIQRTIHTPAGDWLPLEDDPNREYTDVLYNARIRGRFSGFSYRPHPSPPNGLFPGNISVQDSARGAPRFHKTVTST